MSVLADALSEAGVDESFCAFLRRKAPSRKDVDEVYPAVPMPPYPPTQGLTVQEANPLWEAHRAACRPYWRNESQRHNYTGKRAAWRRRLEGILETLLGKKPTDVQ